MTGGRASRGSGPDAPRAVGERKVPRRLGLFALSPSTSGPIGVSYLVVPRTYVVYLCSCSHFASLKTELGLKANICCVAWPVTTDPTR